MTQKDETKPVFIGQPAEPKPVSMHAVIPLDGALHVNAYMVVATNPQTTEGGGVEFQRAYAEVGRWVMGHDSAYMLAQLLARNLPPEGALALADSIAATAQQQINAHAPCVEGAQRGVTGAAH